MLNVPPSWLRMSDHARACYLVDSYQALNYRDARRKLGRIRRGEMARRALEMGVEKYQADLARKKLD